MPSQQIKNTSKQYWAVVPAAGSGLRFGSQTPKQYLEIAGKSILRHTLEKLHKLPWLEGVIVAIQKNDNLFDKNDFLDLEKLTVVQGGPSRAESVLNALTSFKTARTLKDWVLVHDAVRPCVSIEDIELLKNTVSDNLPGGILASPVRETIKRINKIGDVSETVDRTDLWLAATPQLCQMQLLLNALTDSLNKGFNVTDESSAMEYMGHSLKIVKGSTENIKITLPEDLALAELILNKQFGNY